jgi:hypothetical protein
MPVGALADDDQSTNGGAKGGGGLRVSSMEIGMIDADNNHSTSMYPNVVVR